MTHHPPLASRDKPLGFSEAPDASGSAYFGHTTGTDHVRELGKQFQRGLDELFLRNRSTKYPELIEAYGVF